MVLEGNMDMGSSDSSVVVAFKVLLASPLPVPQWQVRLCREWVLTYI